MYLLKKVKKKKKYLLFADLPVGLVFKPLFDASQGHVSEIFGNILSETTEEGQREEGTHGLVRSSQCTALQMEQILLAAHLRITIGQ